MIDAKKVAHLVLATNELVQRLGEYQVKEAQYKNHAEGLVPEIVDGLIELNVLSEDKKREAEESLMKNASIALDMFHAFVKEAKENRPQNSYIGRPYSSYNNPQTNVGSGWKNRYIEVDDTVVDVSRLL